MGANVFDPPWTAAARASAPDVVLYDGDCGLCHGAVKFLLALDEHGERFRYAPLSGEKARALLAERAPGPLPDSIVVVASDGAVRVRSGAALYLLARLGGLWSVLAALSWLTPRFLRDLTYDFVARVRKRLFAKPTDVCPIVPRELRDRFL
jgi:predicted DCC family thiol-disulfide oxidoreductase YuxK